MASRDSQQFNPKTNSSPVTEIESFRAFRNFIGSDGLRVVTFHASFCRTCKAFGIKVRRLARMTEENALPIHFGSLEMSQNPELIRALNIKKVPYIQIYYESDLVSEFVCRPSEMKKLIETINDNIHVVSDGKEEHFESVMNDGQALVEHLMEKSVLTNPSGARNDTVANIPFDIENY
mmetsp:Transcript_9617/g.21359  ORF Transcript_9617/g.21359 Transcript_9617/m.21359 type:complete len:178 (-) Transcript_9617:211-744(-)